MRTSARTRPAAVIPLLPAIASVAVALLLFAADSGEPLKAAAAGGPVVLMGIDAEDGGVGSHGPIAAYESVVNDILSNVTNGGSGILVIGGGKAADDVTEFWDQIATDTGVAVTYVNGDANIAAQSFSGFAMIAVVSSVSETPSGGLTEAENDALAARVSDIAAFVNTGGGLLGFSQAGFTLNIYDYLGGLGRFTVNTNLSYTDITPTAAGLAVGITDALDICCWHDEYVTFPAFLGVLATNSSTGNPAAIGGDRVVVLTEGPFGDPTCSDGIDNDADELIDAADPDCAPPTPTPTPTTPTATPTPTATTPTPTPTPTATTPTPTSTPIHTPQPPRAPDIFPPSGGPPSDSGSGGLPWLALAAGALAITSGGLVMAYRTRRIR